MTFLEIAVTKTVTHSRCMNSEKKIEDSLPPEILMEMRPNRIGYRMSLFRRALGMEKSEIADALGVERTYWSRTENGTRALSKSFCAAIVSRFDVTADFLIYGNWSGLPVRLAEEMRRIQSEDKVIQTDTGNN